MDTTCLIAAIEGVSVRERLHRVINDLEMIMKQMSEVVTTPRDDRGLAKELNMPELAKLFKIKEQELEKTLKIAAQQAERQKVIEQLEQDVRKRDEYLLKIRNCLRDSESLMTNAIFQANQKLKAIAVADHQKVSAEDLIRYAHRISACNAVAAPLTWQQGDPQRPFPTDVEMRSGILSQVASGDFFQQHIANIGMGPHQSSGIPSTPTLLPTSGQGPSAAPGMHPFMPPESFSPLHRPFSPTAAGAMYQGSPGSMMPPRNMPGGWIAQRALTPPNVSPRALRLPQQQFQQHTPPSHSHFVGGPVSPMGTLQSPLAQQHPMLQTTPPQQFQHQFGARASPQQQQLRAHLPPQIPFRQTSPASAVRVKLEPQTTHQSDTVELLSSDSSSSSSSDSPE